MVDDDDDLDIYHFCRYNPVFTRVYPDAPKNKNMQRIGFWNALRLCAKMPVLTSDSKELSSLKQIAADASKHRRGPVVVFPEGTTSNGRALLKFAPVFREFQPSDRNVRFHLFAFRYIYIFSLNSSDMVLLTLVDTSTETCRQPTLLVTSYGTFLKSVHRQVLSYDTACTFFHKII